MNQDKKHKTSKHWIFQLVSAFIIIPLALWFVIEFSKLVSKPYEEVHQWFLSPWHSLGVILLVPLLFYHGTLGIQVVWEDYVSDISCRKKLIFLTNFVSWIGSILAICACLFIYIKGFAL